MIAGLVICAVMLVIGAAFVNSIAKFNILSTSYIVLISALIVGLAIFFACLQRWITSGIITKIIAVMLSVVMVVLTVYLRTTDKVLDYITGTVTQIDNVRVYVLADSSYESVEDLKDSRYGIIAQLDRDNTDKVIVMIKEETGADVSVSEYEGVIPLVDGLYNEEVDAIILNSSFLAMLEGMDGYMDIDDRIRSVWTTDFETVVNKPGSQGKPGDSQGASDSNGSSQDYLQGGDDVFTIYVSGIDINGSPTVNRNSDVNILMTVNTKTRQILMINTPRDFYVPLSISNGVNDKLTHAGCYGIQVSVDTLQMLYGINIDDYIKVNFTGFVEVIDLLGGVDVYSEYDFTTIHGGYHYNAGYNTLDGIRALAFARERYAFGSGDRQRGKNQMAVISAVINKMTTTDALRNYNSILDSLSSSIATSMTYEEITGLIKMQLSDMRGWDIVTYSVDGVGDNLMTFSLTSPNYVMVPTQSTVDQAKEYLRQIYAGERIEK